MHFITCYLNGNKKTFEPSLAIEVGSSHFLTYQKLTFRGYTEKKVFLRLV